MVIIIVIHSLTPRFIADLFRYFPSYAADLSEILREEVLPIADLGLPGDIRL